MKVLEKLEDYKLPDVGSAKVKECMQDAVKRAWRLRQDNEEFAGYPITVGSLTGIFHDLSSDCDFINKACINSKFKKVIDTVFDDITPDEVLGILNDAYAIAIHAANTDFPEYEIRSYRDMADRHLRSTHARDMVLAFGTFLLKECAQCDNTPDILKSEFAREIYTTLLGLHCLDVLCEEGPEYDLHEQKDLDNLKKRLNPPPHPVEPLLDAMVRYAEALPADKWSAINAIGHMLHAKGAAGRYIPTKVYQKYEQRIDKLANYPKPKTVAKDGNEGENAATGVEQGLSGEKKTSSADINEEAKTENPPKAPEKSYLKNNRNWLFAEHEDQIKWAEIFDEFIANRTRKIEREAEIGTEKGNFINKVLARFIYEWKSAGLLNTSRTKQSATVFLFESCKLKSRVDLDSHSNVVERLLAKGFKEEDKNDNLHIDVVEIMEQNKKHKTP